MEATIDFDPSVPACRFGVEGDVEVSCRCATFPVSVVDEVDRSASAFAPVRTSATASTVEATIDFEPALAEVLRPVF